MTETVSKGNIYYIVYSSYVFNELFYLTTKCNKTSEKGKMFIIYRVYKILAVKNSLN